MTNNQADAEYAAEKLEELAAKLRKGQVEVRDWEWRQDISDITAPGDTYRNFEPNGTQSLKVVFYDPEKDKAKGGTPQGLIQQGGV